MTAPLLLSEAPANGLTCKAIDFYFFCKVKFIVFPGGIGRRDPSGRLNQVGM